MCYVVCLYCIGQIEFVVVGNGDGFGFIFERNGYGYWIEDFCMCYFYCIVGLCQQGWLYEIVFIVIMCMIGGQGCVCFQFVGYYVLDVFVLVVVVDGFYFGVVFQWCVELDFFCVGCNCFDELFIYFVLDQQV